MGFNSGFKGLTSFDYVTFVWRRIDRNPPEGK